MEGFVQATPFARLVAEALGDKTFTLIDVGCSIGIDEVWRVFGTRLRAFGFDPNVSEIERLTAHETLPSVKYVPAFVRLAPGDPNNELLRSRNLWARNPWSRLSVARITKLREQSTAEMPADAKTGMNLWHKTSLASTDEAIFLPDYLRQQSVNDVDFIKIDVDGADFLILRSIEKFLSDAGVLGVGIEVNFFGSEDPDVNTFHNVDRFMKRSGFEIFSLSTRKYSGSALPAPGQVSGAQTVWGRIWQGDAIYFRDAAAPECEAWSQSVQPSKLLKLAAVFSLANLPDCAAEILLKFEASLKALIDVQRGLDALTAQCAPRGTEPLTYGKYVERFETEAIRVHPASAGEGLVALDPPDLADEYNVVSVPTDSVELLGSASSRPTAWPISLQSLSTPWSYAAYISIPRTPEATDRPGVFVRVTTSFAIGEPWIGALTPDEGAFVSRLMVPAGEADHEILFGPIDLRNVSKFVVENGARAEPSRVTIESVSILVPAASSN